jgi:hypothetical protein
MNYEKVISKIINIIPLKLNIFERIDKMIEKIKI